MAKHLSDGFLSEFDGASFFLNADPTVYVDGVAEPIVENVSQGVGETVCEVEQQHQRQSLLPLENATPMMIQTAAETIEVVAEKQQQTEKKQKEESKKASKKRQTEESDLDNPKPLEEAVKKTPGRRGRKPKSKQSMPTKESPNQKSGASKSTGRGKRVPSPIPGEPQVVFAEPKVVYAEPPPQKKQRHSDKEETEKRASCCCDYLKLAAESYTQPCMTLTNDIVTKAFNLETSYNSRHCRDELRVS